MNQYTVRRLAGQFLVLLCATIAGCEPQLDPEQYGKVVYELPKVEGANLPYPLPQLEDLPQEPPAEPTTPPEPSQK
jgi:hypothetical protein